MLKLELSIAASYVNWGVWEALRELMQNGQDGDDRGFPLTVNYNAERQRLNICNDGVKLGRESLVLGTTTKKDSISQRGEFGEGYKLALATLLNLGKKVAIFNQDELWVPTLEYSEQFNTEVLCITIKSMPKVDKLNISITGIEQEQWDLVKSRLLFMPHHNLDSAIESNRGTILKDKGYAGKLYVKGIYVDKMPDEYSYGYDLMNVKLDRDRNIPDAWSLRREIRGVLKDATIRGQLAPREIFEVLNAPLSGEAQAFMQDYDKANEFHERLKEYFEELHGDSAVPVQSIGESIEAGHYGLKGIVVAAPLHNVLAKVITPFSKLKDKKATEVTKLYSYHDLTQEEKDNLQWAVELVAKVEDKMDINHVAIVDFLGDKVFGLFDSDVKIAKRILTDRRELIATMVHEVAHNYGGDGTVGHRDACERIFSSIICM